MNRGNRLGWGEYISPDQNENTEIAEARWQFAQVVRRILPRFFEELRERVYPQYAHLSESRPDYWQAGWTFETWHLCSDRDNQLTPHLLSWARAFGVQEETWMLEGALQTLWLWNKDRECRDSIDIVGFHSCRAVDSFDE